MEEIRNLITDEESAFYNSSNKTFINCRIDGIADGESAFKECRNIRIIDSYFNLRYPVWHGVKVEIKNCEFSNLARASFWYCNDVKIANSKIFGVKALRECNDIQIVKTDIISEEFGVKVNNINIIDSNITGVYSFFSSSNINISNIHFSGKYSFQYVKNLTITSSYLDTKDAFWHAENVIVKDSYIKGEYLGWYSNNITLINCTVDGTQPLCYAKNLKMIDCKMVNADKAFENTTVEANIIGHVDSIKNPLGGKIIVDSVGEIINDDTIYNCCGEVIIKKN